MSEGEIRASKVSKASWSYSQLKWKKKLLEIESRQQWLESDRNATPPAYHRKNKMCALGQHGGHRHCGETASPFAFSTLQHVNSIFIVHPEFVIAAGAPAIPPAFSPQREEGQHSEEGSWHFQPPSVCFPLRISVSLATSICRKGRCLGRISRFFLSVSATIGSSSTHSSRVFT